MPYCSCSNALKKKRYEKESYNYYLSGNKRSSERVLKKSDHLLLIYACLLDTYVWI